jgi:hypothetical protein
MESGYQSKIPYPWIEDSIGLTNPQYYFRQKNRLALSIWKIVNMEFDPMDAKYNG